MKIHREDRYLYELNDSYKTGCPPMNIWACSVQAQNGNAEQVALKVATLFEAAPDLLDAAKKALDLLTCAEMDRVKIKGKQEDIRALMNAINKAEGL